jgi:molecular chaperone DnaK
MSTVPSVIGLDPEGKVIVGSQAQNNLIMDPGNTVIEIKRLMGTYEREPDPARNDPGVPKTVPFRNRSYLPQEISAFILMELKRMAEDLVGEPIHDAVITVPAYFREPQKGATADAAAMARLNLCMLLNEPTAAAVSFGMDQIKDDNQHIYAVYDLGGGTFDVSIISVTKDEVSVVGTGGDPKLGGGDFDDRITGYVVDYIRDKHHVDLSQAPDYPSLWARIKREAELRKRELSTSTSTMLSLPYLTGQLSVNVPLSRATFESLIGDLLKNSLDCLDQAIASAYESNGITRDMIEEVLLVGGSTRVACIRPMLADYMGMELQSVRYDIDPDEVVSRGAAIVAMRFHPKDAFEGEEVEIDMNTAEGQAEAEMASTQAAAIILNDVTSHSLGIMVNEGDFFPLIPKDSQIPARREQDGFTNAGRTRMIDVMIFQGESPNALDNTLIGKLPIPLPEERERGYYQFQVTFALDTNGLLNVTVLCLNDNSLWDTKVQCNVRASREAIDQSAEHLHEVMAGKDEEQPAEPQPFRPGAVPPPPPRAGAPMPQPPRPQPTPTPQPTPPPSQPAPRPAAQPASTPQPAQAAQPVPPAQPVQTAPSGGALPMPPENTPEEHKGLARRSYKKLNQLPVNDPNYNKLRNAYLAFVEAVLGGDPELEDYVFDLNELYMRAL